MTGIEQRVIVFGRDELEWSFQGSEGPLFYTRPPKGGYRRSVPVDPFPAYSHSAELVAEAAARVESCFPVPDPPTYYLMPFETTHRTNGWANENEIYESGRDPRKAATYDTSIILSGKRIPPHPAMTRYLVAHEDGHIVDWALGRRRGFSNEEFRAKYIETLRREASTEYGGGRWHRNIGELIANDFRICVAGVEAEFWPHPGFEHPMDLPAVIQFWRDAVVEVFA